MGDYVFMLLWLSHFGLPKLFFLFEFFYLFFFDVSFRTHNKLCVFVTEKFFSWLACNIWNNRFTQAFSFKFALNYLCNVLFGHLLMNKNSGRTNELVNIRLDFFARIIFILFFSFLCFGSIYNFLYIAVFHILFN